MKKDKIQHFTWLSRIILNLEILDKCKVSSWKNPRKEIEAYLKKQYRRKPIPKIGRIIDEKKLLHCPTELIWDSYARQDSQGRCPYCGFEFVHYLGREKNTKENFKYCLGFGQSELREKEQRDGRELVIIYECPECFEKSECHVNHDWFYLYGEWIVDAIEMRV